MYVVVIYIIKPRITPMAFVKLDLNTKSHNLNFVDKARAPKESLTELCIIIMRIPKARFRNEMSHLNETFPKRSRFMYFAPSLGERGR